VRRILSSRGDHEPLREEVERLRSAREEDGWTLAELARRVAALEQKLAQMEAAPGGKRGWFKKG
jgi:ribosome-binding protein aMBF1 (putative translation factor)